MSRSVAQDLNLPPAYMATLVSHLLQEALQSFVNRTPAKARAVIPLDKEIDALNRDDYEALVNLMTGNPVDTWSLHFTLLSPNCLLFVTNTSYGELDLTL